MEVCRLNQGSTHRVTRKEGSIRPISCIRHILLLNLQKQNGQQLKTEGKLNIPTDFRVTLNTHRLAVAAMEIIIQCVHVSEKVT